MRVGGVLGYASPFRSETSLSNRPFPKFIFHATVKYFLGVDSREPWTAQHDKFGKAHSPFHSTFDERERYSASEFASMTVSVEDAVRWECIRRGMRAVDIRGRSWVEDCWSVRSSSWKSQRARVARPRHPTKHDSTQDVRLGASCRESAGTDSLARRVALATSRRLQRQAYALLQSVSTSPTRPPETRRGSTQNDPRNRAMTPPTIASPWAYAGLRGFPT